MADLFCELTSGNAGNQGSVPRNRAHAACEEAATALLAPPVTFVDKHPPM